MIESSINLSELSNLPVNYQEEREVHSQNHSLIQARLGGLFNLDDCFNAATELTLEVSHTIASVLEVFLKRYQYESDKFLFS
jgi:hypothetical protein